MDFKSEVTTVGRHVHEGCEYQSEPSGARYRWDNYGEKPTWPSLSEAAARAHTSVEEVKRMIRDGELEAGQLGLVTIHRRVLDGWRYRV